MRIGVAGYLMAFLRAALRECGVISPGIYLRAKVEKCCLCPMASKNVEVLRSVDGIGPIVERDGDEAVAVGRLNGLAQGDDKVLGFLRYAQVDGLARMNARYYA